MRAIAIALLLAAVGCRVVVPPTESFCAADDRLMPSIERGTRYWQEAGVPLADACSTDRTAWIALTDELDGLGETSWGPGYVRPRVTVLRMDRPEQQAWVVTHEMGHALGLDHQTTESSIMWAYLKYGMSDDAIPWPRDVELARGLAANAK